MKNNTRKNTTHSRGFTLIELLVVIAIIVILSTIAMIALQNTRAKGRDTRRIADVDQMQTALTLYFRDKGRYPSTDEFVFGGSLTATTSAGTVVYMNNIPTAPNPADGNCSASDNTYHYNPASDLKTYTIYYCLGGPTGDVAPGMHGASGNGINAEPAWSLLATYNGYAGSATAINGVPYIAYNLGPQDGYHGFVKKYVNGNWENVGLGDTGISTGSAVSVYLNGDLYAFYITFDGGEHVAVSKYTGNGATGWEQLGDQSFFPFSNTNISESWTIKNNTVYVIYNYSDGILVAKFDGTNWVQLGATITNTYLDIANIAVDDDNGVYIIYHSISDKNVYVKKFNSGSSTWDQIGGNIDFADGGIYRDYALKIISGQPCVFNYSQAYSNYILDAIYFNGTSWEPLGYTFNRYAPSGFASTYAPSLLSVEFANNKAYISYKDADSGGKVSILQNDLKPGSTWSNAGYPGLSDGVISLNSLFTDNSGTLYLSYMDGGKTYIKKYSR